MQNIQLDDDVYKYIASQTVEIGESASDILRRLLGLGGKTTCSVLDEGVAELLKSPQLKFGSAVDKFLFILGEAYKLKPDNFSRILTVQGPNRLYFANSRDQIEKSGKSTQPKQIPGTPYWAMTNTSTDKKVLQLQQVLTAVGFDEKSVKIVSKAIL